MLGNIVHLFTVHIEAMFYSPQQCKIYYC